MVTRPFFYKKNYKMKKILIAILLTLSISTQAQVINENYIKSGFTGIHPAPKQFSSDGKTYLTFENKNKEGMNIGN